MRQQRFPTSVAARLRWPLPRGFDATGAIGLALVPLRLRGDGLGTSTPAMRLDVGARMALEVVTPALVGSAAPFLGVHAEFFPRPYVLDVSPLADTGTTSRFWVGFAAGMVFGTDR